MSGASEALLPLSPAELLRFPSARDMALVEALWDSTTATIAAYHQRDGAGTSWGEYRSDAEGPAPFLRFGPGMLWFGRVDRAKAERAAERRRTPHRLDALGGSDEGAGVDGDARSGDDPVVGALGADSLDGGQPVPLLAVEGSREEVSQWSPRSRARLIRTVLSLDLAPLVQGETAPAMVTLTLPGDWLAVCPSAAAAAETFHRWRRAYERRWDGPLRCIWKREFQRRGAPHWHLWLVPPVPPAGLPDFREWLSASWTHAVFLHGGDPDERARHLRAGTGVDVAEGLRARDPKRLAIYFLKESLGGDGKAYQNRAPAEWGGQSVGRYWGVRGIPQAVREVQLDPLVAHKLWRALRKAAEARRGPHRVRVPRVDARTGTVRQRTVTRRRRLSGPAGWVAVNDGARAAEEAARYWAQLLEEASNMRASASAEAIAPALEQGCAP